MSTVERTTAPPLQACQRLKQPEFHARYHVTPPGTRAELVGGVVVLPSPSGNLHEIVDAAALCWLGIDKSPTPGTQVSSNTTTILDDDNEFQPDGWLMIKPAKGGQPRDVGNYVGGCPELVLEVASSSRSIDLGPKLAEYEKAGALEYVVCAVRADEVHWHVRQGDRLVRVGPGVNGIDRSTAFSGLWLDQVALFEDDGSSLLATFDRGLATVEHTDFVTRLAGR